MKKRELKGVLPVFQMPYDDRENIDFSILEKEIDWLYENECDGDLNGDGGYNVLDVVILVNCVLADNCSS